MNFSAPHIVRPAANVLPIDTEEAVPIDFDFTVALPDGAVISGTPVITCEVEAGTDANPAARLSGAPQVSGSYVRQFFAGAVPGCTYLVRCVATLSALPWKLTLAARVPAIRVGDEGSGAS
jgi:hypothetical protein